MRPLDRDDPREIGGYRILRVLGVGGMGRVYLARSPGGRTVAVKVIRPELSDDPGFRHLFRREVAAARRVGGAWTAPVIDADTEAPRPWLVTGYVAGPSVFEAVERHGPLPESSVRTLGAGLAEALVGIHGTGLIHRDLKPTNVLLSLDGPRVIDFGISRALDASVHTRTGSTVGSPGFMSPEQVDGRDVGPATDIFSLGSVLVFAATAEGPFGAGNGQALMFRIVSKPPELGAVPPALRDLISACLAKYAGNRPSPQEILAQLAPDGGTAALVAPGWLPGPLTTDLSRRAIALLEIDELAPQPAPEPVTEAPPPTGRPGVRPAGPPPPPSKPPSVPSSPGPGRIAPPTGRPAPPMPPAMPAGMPVGLPPAMPAGAAAGMSAGYAGLAGQAGQFAGAASEIPSSMPGPHCTPAAAPAAPPRPAKPGTRRGTPWLYLSAIAAAVSIISTSALIARSGSETATTDSADVGSATRSPSPADGSSALGSAPASRPATGDTAARVSGSTAPVGAATRIPDAYVGTWSGTIRSGTGLTTSTFTVVLHQPDGKGVVASTSSQVNGGLVTGTCTSDSTLVSVGGDGLLLQDVPDGKPQPTVNGLPLCATGGQITLRLDAPGGDTLTCRIIAESTGNPSGTLRRTG